MKRIRKLGTVQYHLVEVSPFVYRDKLLIFESVRPRTPDNTHEKRHYLRIRELHDGTRDVRTPEEFAAGRVLAEFGDGFTFGCPFAWADEVFVYASGSVTESQENAIHVFRSKDMKTWTESVALAAEQERLFNNSVCWTGERFIMAYETDDRRWPAFTIRFAESHDLIHWTRIPFDRAVYGTDRYTACPTIRFMDCFFYMFYLEWKKPDWRFEEYLARSRDLVRWEQSPANPILAPEPELDQAGCIGHFAEPPGADINNSDIDFTEFGGQVVIYYSWGNQRGEERLAHAVWDGTLSDWLRACYA